MNDDMIKVSDFAKKFNISKSKAYEIVNKNDFPKIFIGGSIRISEKEAEKYILDETKRIIEQRKYMN